MSEQLAATELPPKKSGDAQDPLLYKSELCRSWSESGTCRYGNKCQFAHGVDELRLRLRDPKYKTKTCRSWQERGMCSYGQRCQFLHDVVGARSPGQSTASSSPSSLSSQRFTNMLGGYSSSVNSGFSPPLNVNYPPTNFQQSSGVYPPDAKPMYQPSPNESHRLHSPHYSPFLGPNGIYTNESKAPLGYPASENVGVQVTNVPYPKQNSSLDTDAFVKQFKIMTSFHYNNDDSNHSSTHYPMTNNAAASMLLPHDSSKLSPTFALRMRHAAIEYQALVESAQVSADSSIAPSPGIEAMNAMPMQYMGPHSARSYSDPSVQAPNNAGSSFQPSWQQIQPNESLGYAFNGNNSYDYHNNMADPQLNHLSVANNQLGILNTGVSLLPNMTPNNASRSNSHPNIDYANNTMRATNPNDYQYLPSVSTPVLQNKMLDSRSVTIMPASYPSAKNVPGGLQYTMESRFASSPPAPYFPVHEQHFVANQIEPSAENLDASPPSRARLDVFKNINS